MTHRTAVDEKEMKRVKELMKQHEEEAEFELNEEFRQQVPAHAIYFVGVVIGAFVLNLLVLLLVAGGG